MKKLQPSKRCPAIWQLAAFFAAGSSNGGVKKRWKKSAAYSSGGGGLLLGRHRDGAEEDMRIAHEVIENWVVTCDIEGLK